MEPTESFDLIFFFILYENSNICIPDTIYTIQKLVSPRRTMIALQHRFTDSPHKKNSLLKMSILKQWPSKIVSEKCLHNREGRHIWSEFLLLISQILISKIISCEFCSWNCCTFAFRNMAANTFPWVFNLLTHFSSIFINKIVNLNIVPKLHCRELVAFMYWTVLLSSLYSALQISSSLGLIFLHDPLSLATTHHPLTPSLLRSSPTVYPSILTLIILFFLLFPVNIL